MYSGPSRRDFLKMAGGVAGAALAGKTLYAHHHPRPMPQSMKYLDQRIYLHNMEIVAHVPGAGGFGSQVMTTPGGQRVLFHGIGAFDVTDPRNPKVIYRSGANGLGVGFGQLAYNKDHKKWFLMQASQTPYFTTEHMPGGKYSAPETIQQFKDWKGLRGIRMIDVTDPTSPVQVSEWSTGSTSSGVHPDSYFYDGGKYAYLDVAPDETYTGMIANLTPYSNCLMIVDVSDPANIKEVSRWHVPGQRAGVPGETQMLKKWKCLEGRGTEKIPDKPLTMEEATSVFKELKFAAFDRMPYTMSHLPFYVPKRAEDGGTIAYGSWSAFGFIIHDISDIKNPKPIGRFDPAPEYGMDGIPFHTIWLGFLDRGFVVTIPESLNPDCNESYLPCWVVDVRNPRNPVPIAQLPRPNVPPDAPFDDFCLSRGRFSPHLPPSLTAPGRMSRTILPVSWFNAGVRVFDLSVPTAPSEVAYFVSPHGGKLSPECADDPDKLEGDLRKKCDDEGNSYNRPTDTMFAEWDRNLIYAGTTTGLYILSTPALGKPVLGAMPAREWSLPGLNAGAPA
jgi:hypothetical protein